jgi:predicted Zn-dependent peptidase
MLNTPEVKCSYKIANDPTGVTVATAEIPHMSSVSVGIWVGIGGRYEPPVLCGVSHFIEHMLFKGTQRRNAREISQDVEGIGGYLNAFTTEETTCFYAKAASDRFAHVWDVLADMFLNSTFDPGEVEKERAVIREELAMYLDQPHHHVQDLLNETLWPDQPLGRPLTGTEKTLGALRREDLIRFKEQNYVTRGTLIAVAGNIDHETARKAASKFGKKFSKANRRGFEPAVCQQDAPRLRLHKKETEQTQLALALRTCSRHDERRFALRLLNVMLGENMSSRLFQVVREDNGLAYSICSSLGFFDDVGTLTISAGVETERLEKALKLIMGELALFIRQSPSAAELRRARDYIFGQLDLSLENTENQMTWLGEHYLGYGKIISPEEVKTQLAEVTPGQIRAVARDFFAPDRLGLALVSPIDKPADVRAIVSRFEP